MSKHTHRSLAEQIGNKVHVSAPVPYKNRIPQENESMESENVRMKVAIDNNSIQLRAYQIYQEKGGSDLDNWLEAERILKNDEA